MPRGDKIAVFKINPSPDEGLCRIIEDGEICDVDIKARGLCSKHHEYFRHRGEKGLPKYGTAPIRKPFVESDYEINLEAPITRCRVIECGKKCLKKSYRRGVCSPHYSKLNYYSLTHKFGLPWNYKNLTINEHPKEGRCRVIQNRKPCPRKVYARGVCQRHSQINNAHKYQLPVSPKK